MEELLPSISEHLVWVIVGVCFIVGMVIKSATHIMTNLSRERSRREIAAYVAEGSISPDQGERLIKAEVAGASSGAL